MGQDYESSLMGKSLLLLAYCAKGENVKKSFRITLNIFPCRLRSGARRDVKEVMHRLQRQMSTSSGENETHLTKDLNQNEEETWLKRQQKYREQLVEANKKIYGENEDHPETADSLYDLATVCSSKSWKISMD